jgi:hypothetical protein
MSRANDPNGIVTKKNHRIAQRFIQMRALLDNQFAPITFTFGFIESPFDRLSEAFAAWQSRLDTEYNTRTEVTRFVAPFPQALQRLEPLTTPLDRYLLVETRSAWVAIFSNGLRVNDVSSPVGYLPTLLDCRGLQVSCVPDRSSVAGKDGLRIYGNVSFTLYGPEKTDFINRIRHVSVMNDVSGWEFAAGGQVQPYEQVENYERRKVVERFTPEMLESYCNAIGIELFDSSFYGGSSLLSQKNIKRPALRGLAMSIDEARSHLYL